MSKEKSSKKPEVGSLVLALVTNMDITAGKVYRVANSERDLDGVSVWDDVGESWYLTVNEFEVLRGNTRSLTEPKESSNLIEQEYDGMEIVG